MIPRCLLALAVIVGLAGCTAGADHPSDTRRPATARTNATHSPVGIPDGVVGSAPITAVSVSGAGASLGTVEFVSVAAGVEMRVPSAGFGTDAARTIVGLADSPFSPASCGTDNIWELGFSLNDPHTPTLESGMYDGGDPSFFTAVVVSLGVDAIGSACSQRIVATGPITWTIPLQRPWVHPDDGGVRLGATGSVTVAGGEPRVYTTAKGDAWNTIASRFGISASDLAWLNPKRLGGGTPGEAYAQQLLNLDPGNRGDSESRRPH